MNYPVLAPTPKQKQQQRNHTGTLVAAVFLPKFSYWTSSHFKIKHCLTFVQTVDGVRNFESRLAFGLAHRTKTSGQANRVAIVTGCHWETGRMRQCVVDPHPRGHRFASTPCFCRQYLWVDSPRGYPFPIAFKRVHTEPAAMITPFC